MDERIGKIEREIAIISQTNKVMGENITKMADTMNKLLELQTDTKLHSQRIELMDREAAEAFKRVYIRIEKLEQNHSWVAKTIIGAVITGAIGFVYFMAKH